MTGIPWKSAVVVGVASVALACVPLFGVFGFEYAAAVGFVLTVIAGWRACGAAGRAAAAGGDAGRFPGRALLRAGGENALLLVPPLVVAAARAALVPACNVAEGVRFYLLLPVPGVAYGTALGFAAGLAAGARRGRRTFLLWGAATLAWRIAMLLAQPPKFAYNAFIGYFPGPLYDTEVPITSTLVLARGVVALQAGLALAIAVLAWDGKRLRARRSVADWTGERAAVGVAAAALAVALAAIAANGQRLGLAPTRASIQRTLGGHLRTAHCDIFYDRAAIPPARAARLAREHETRWLQLRAWFGVLPPHRIRSYVYASPAQKKRLMGAGGTSFEDALNDEFHVHDSGEEPHPVLTHEMAHIFAAQLDRWMPVCPKIGLHEGIAVAAEWNEESARLGMTPHAACVAMDSLDLLPDLSRSLGAFGFWTQPGARAYTAAGSFVRWLVETYGMPRFRAAWRWGDLGRAYGKPQAALLAEWHAMLRGVRVQPQELRRAERLFRGGSVFDERCAHERARVEAEADAAFASGDARRADSLYARVQALVPEDPAPQLDRARARLRLGDADGAARFAHEILDGPRRGLGQARAAWRTLGEAAWRSGDFAAADTGFAHAAASGGSSAELRADEVARLALRDPALRESLRDYLCDAGLRDAAGLALLARARAAAPSSGLPRYLLGRRLYQAGEAGPALEELEACLADTTLGSRTRLAALDLAGRSALQLGRRDAARAGFEAAAAAATDEGDRLGLLDWLGRVDLEPASGTP